MFDPGLEFKLSMLMLGILIYIEEKKNSYNNCGKSFTYDISVDYLGGKNKRLLFSSSRIYSSIIPAVE